LIIDKIRNTTLPAANVTREYPRAGLAMCRTGRIEDTWLPIPQYGMKLNPTA